MINFPDSPYVGQIFNSGVGLYQWDGTAWNAYTAATRTALDNNLVVNPCPHISAENGAAAGTASGYFLADQWQLSYVAAGAAVSVKIDPPAQVNDSGSIYRMQLKVTTAKASLAAGDYIGLTQRIEGIRCYGLKWGAANPKQTILRFGFKGPAGTYSAAIRNAGNSTIAWTGNFTIAQANVDTIQTFVIPPPPSGYAWATGSSPEIDLWITLAASTTYTAPLANGWQAGSFIAGAGVSNFLATVNNTAEIWDVGLYPDPDLTGVPPRFTVPDLADDLFECQRYYRKYSQSSIYTGYGVGGNGFWGDNFFEPPMRVAPSCAGLNVTFANCSGMQVNAVDTQHVRLGVNITATGVAYFLYDLACNART